MSLVEHAEYELQLAGYNVNNTDENSESYYADFVGKCALDLIKLLASQKHSGFTANATVALFNRLAQQKPLTKELSDNPNEWIDRTEMSGYTVYQSKRNPSCFSTDMKVYWDIDDDENNDYVEEDGEKYAILKPMEERKLVELKHV